ncbi:YadA-like family protein [Neisseria sp. P0017.S005]|uniref:YadA-like family protein n=5 Tax=unclassified Neisseria TaxID=2623750 RepID=UPI003F7FFDB2
MKSSRFVCTALASALMMTAGYANAGPGIFINDGNDAGCIVTSDESSRRNALFFLSNNNLEWAAEPTSGGSMPSANAFRNKCSPADAASQTNRALFHGDAGGAGSKHLSLGGRLDVNSGIIGLGDRAAGNNSIRIGSGNTLQAANSQSNSVAIGNDVETKAALAVGIGSAAKANGQQSVAVGNSVEASGNFSVAIGTSARANAAQTVALGNNANAAGEDALAIGRSANAQAKDSIAFGRSSQAAAKGVAIGSEASAAVANSVALGSGKTAVAAADQSGTKNVNGLNYTYVGNSANSSVTVGNRQIKQVGAGEVSAASADAINGSQLHATQNVVGNIGKGVAANLGGGAVLKPDGTFTAPTYSLTDANGNVVSKNNVGDALNVLNSRLNNVGGGFQVAATTGTTQNVKPGNTLKFIDGTNTTTEVSTDGAGVTTVKINATGGGAAVPLTSNAATGQVNAPAAADANKAATAGSVATAINTAVSKSGFNVQGGSVAGGSVTGAATTKVNNGSTVKLQAGKNIALSQSGADFTFATAENLSVTSVTATDAAGNKTVTNGSGVTITPAAAGSSPVRLTTSGLDNGGNKITNLTSGNVAAGDNSAVTGGAVNTAINTAINTAVTDLKDAGFKIGADSGADDTVKLGETVKYAGDANIKTTVTNNQIGFKLADSITVGPASGGSPVTVDGSAGTVTGLTNKTWNPAGIVSGRAATEDQLKAVTNQVNSSATHYYSVNDGGGAHGGNFNNDGATGLNALAAGVGASAQDNDAVAIGSGTIAQGNGSIAIGAAAEVSGATGAGGIAIGAAATAKNGGTAVGSGADTGNGTALIPGLPNRLNNNLALGDSARVKNDTNFNVALGSLSTAGDADLTAAAYKPNATSVIAGDINEAGVKYGEVSLGGDTSHFMSGSKMYRRLTNLAAGSADTDAVNVSQLKAVQAALQDQAPVAYTKADGTKVYKHTDGNFYDAPNGAGNQVAAADVITSLQNAAGSTTAPTTLANVKDNLADTAAAVTNPTGNDRTTLSANKGHNAATVNDVLNAGFTVQGNGVDEDFVTHGDTVNFVNGQGTVANVSSTGGVTTVKFDTPMTYVDTAGTPATTPSNKVNLVGTGGPVTLGNVAAGAVNATSTDAVNGSQLFATNQNVANNAANIAKGINFGGTTGSKNYALGDTINVKGDSNIISETVAGGAQLKLADVLNVGQAAPVKIDGNKGEVSGLSNTTLGGSDFAQGKRAATEEQLNAAQDQLVNVLGGNAANNGGNISMTDIGGTGENNIHDAIKAVNTTANLPLTFGGDSGKDVERKPGTKLNIVGGQTDAAKLSDGNIGVVANGSDKLEVKLAKDLAVDSVKAGDTTVNTDGVKVGDVNLTKAGLNNGGNKITNVAAGTDDTDAVNVAQLNKAAAAAKTEVVQGDNIVVTQNVGANGQTIYKVATDKNLKVDSVTAGDTVMNNDGVKVGDDVALNKDGLKAGDVNLTKAGLNNGGNKITNVAAGTDDTDAVNVSQLKQAATASKTEVVQGKNIVVTEKTGDKGQTVYEVATDKDLDVDSVKAGDTTVNNDGVKVGDDVALNKDGLKAGKVNLTKDGLDNAGNKVTNVADGDINANSKDAVNGSQLYATNQNVANNAATIAKGINFGGTTGSNNYALGDTINVKGDSNIISETVAGGAQLKLADEISVKTVNADTFKAGDTVMNNDGVKVGDKVALNKDGLTAGNTVVNNDGVTIAAPTENNPNNQVKLSPVGLNNGGQRITNVAPGKDGTDAANVNQLIGLGTELQNNINQVGKKAYAGVAGAIAQGSIPQVTSPGETGIGVGSGYYGGQSAMAIGVSAMSDGGNWIVKGNFSANTDGHVGVGVGALYKW